MLPDHEVCERAEGMEMRLAQRGRDGVTNEPILQQLRMR
jgi:hypothetical protein